MSKIAFATYEFFVLALVLDLDVRFPSFIEHLEGEMFDIRLNFGIIELSPD